MTKKMLFVLIASFISVGCPDKNLTVSKKLTKYFKVEKKVNSMVPEVSIEVGEQASEFQKRYPDQIKVQKQPAGLDFYSIDWNERPRGLVKIENDKYSFSIDDVLGLQTHTNVDLPSEGFYNFTIFAGLSTNNDKGLISHDEARLKTYALLKKIELTGWKVITPRSRPRLNGKDRLNYVLKVSNLIGLDTKYVPTLEEWMNIENWTSWTFYADHQYLRVDFKRERTLLDPAKPGSYLLTFSLKSETENFRGYVGPDNRAVWKQKLPVELDDLKQRRQKAEATLRAQGISIDETYQDPPVPDLK